MSETRYGVKSASPAKYEHVRPVVVEAVRWMPETDAELYHFGNEDVSSFVGIDFVRIGSDDRGPFLLYQRLRAAMTVARRGDWILRGPEGTWHLSEGSFLERFVAVSDHGRLLDAQAADLADTAEDVFTEEAAVAFAWNAAGPEKRRSARTTLRDKLRELLS